MEGSEVSEVGARARPPEPVATDPPPSGPARTPGPSRLRRLLRHPGTTIAGLGIVTTAINLWWVQQHRFVGSMEVDETGYLAAALRYQRNLGYGPRQLGARVLETITGPLVPLLSTPLLVVGGRGVWVAQAIQPVLHVVAAIAVTGIVHRVAGRRTALVCGIAALTLPAALMLDRSYQYATAASAFLCLAVWALLVSDRGRRLLPMAGFGLAVAAMALSRTMAIGFVPAVGVGTLLWIRWDRRSLQGLAAAATTCFLGAGLWWLQGWDGIMGYLQRSGYSEFSGYWGSSRFVGRFGRRAEQLGQDVRGPYLVLALLAVLLAGVELVRWQRRGRPAGGWSGARREVAVIWVVVVGGYAALLSTANTGTWFDLPLIFLAIAGLGCLAAPAAAPTAGAPGRRRGRGPRTLLGAAVVVVAVATVVSSLPGPGGRNGHRANRVARTFSSDVDQILTGNFDADARLEGADQEVRRAAAEEWEAANQEVVAVLHRYDLAGGALVMSITGSGHLLNINTLLLASEVTDRTIASVEVPVTFEAEARLRAWLTPFADGAPRLIVRIRSRSLRFPDDRFPKRYDRLVDELGWRARERVALPDGGYVEVLVHPDSDPLTHR